MSEQNIAAAKAQRDKMHTTKLSPKVHDQMKAQLDVEARKQGALQWFYRQFRIRGGKGWGLGSKAGRPSDTDKYLTPRAVKLSEGYAGDSGECRNMTPHEWWAQSAEGTARFLRRLHRPLQRFLVPTAGGVDEGCVDGHCP